MRKPTDPIEVKDVKEILGLPSNMHDLQKGNEAPGVVTGLNGLRWAEKFYLLEVQQRAMARNAHNHR